MEEIGAVSETVKILADYGFAAIFAACFIIITFIVLVKVWPKQQENFRKLQQQLQEQLNITIEQVTLSRSAIETSNRVLEANTGAMMENKRAFEEVLDSLDKLSVQMAAHDERTIKLQENISRIDERAKISGKV